MALVWSTIPFVRSARPVSVYACPVVSSDVQWTLYPRLGRCRAIVELRIRFLGEEFAGGVSKLVLSGWFQLANAMECSLTNRLRDHLGRIVIVRCGFAHRVKRVAFANDAEGGFQLPMVPIGNV